MKDGGKLAKGNTGLHEGQKQRTTLPMECQVHDAFRDKYTVTSE